MIDSDTTHAAALTCSTCRVAGATIKRGNLISVAQQHDFAATRRRVGATLRAEMCENSTRREPIEQTRPNLTLAAAPTALPAANSVLSLRPSDHHKRPALPPLPPLSGCHRRPPDDLSPPTGSASDKRFFTCERSFVVAGGGGGGCGAGQIARTFKHTTGLSR